jgi:hypothetical protein
LPNAPLLAKFTPLFRHPLVIAVLAAVFSALLIPQITREWQDRQREQDLKRSLLEEISTSSTTAVRQGISLAGGQTQAAGGKEGEAASDVYATLRNSWLIRRASARSRIIVYFPKLYACWYFYERAVADYLSLSPPRGTPAGASGEARVESLERYVTGNFAQGYIIGKKSTPTPDTCTALADLPQVVQDRFQELKDASHWSALNFATDNPQFRAAYAILGEALIIGMERIITTIDATPAKGFSHGIGL